jgi:TonB-linked SusC/RagA family outer membrane protein
MKQNVNWIFLFLFALISQVSFAQAQEVTGTVVDNSGLPLPGVNVIEENTSNGTQTDFDGNFSIEVGQDAVLVFSYLGMKTQKITVGSQSNIDVTLNSDTDQLDEVVVTALGIKANPRSLTYAAETVTSQDIENSGETNLVNSLSAKAAGVSVVSSSGSVGASSNIRIRGNTSINRTNGPLFIVDGVPIDNSASGNEVGGVDNSNRAIDINQNDIESLEILKGTAAQTLYGLRAANGVVIITTKKGKSGAPKVTVSSSLQFNRVNQLQDLQSEFAQGQPVAGVPTYRGPETQDGFSWGPRISSLEFDGDSSYPFDRNGRLVPAGEGNGQPANAYDKYDFFTTGVLLDNSVSVSGGTDKVRYYISGAQLDQTGVVPQEEFTRNSFRADITASLRDDLEISASGNYINSGGRRVQRGSNVSGVMLGLVRSTPTFDNGNGLSGRDAADTPSTYLLPDGNQRSYRAGVYDNPYWTVSQNPAFDDVKRFVGRLSFEYKPFDWATIQGTLGYDQYSDKRKQGIDINSAGNPQGQVFNQTILNEDINSQLLLLTEKKINDKLTFNGVIGYDGFKTETQFDQVTGFGMTIPGFFVISNTATQAVSEDVQRRELDAVLADARFAYDDTFFINGTFRNDWSSTLPEDNNSFQSYSFGSSLVFTELFESGAMNYGKLRGSYGRTGNDAPAYSTLTYYNAAASGGDGFIDVNQFPIFSTVAFERGLLLGNNDIVPEETEEFEVGAEFNFFDSRIKLDVAYYNKTTRDQIIQIDQPAVTGFTNRTVNAGVIENKGWEITAGFRPVVTDDFNWNLDVNWTAYDNTVKELAPGVESILLAGFTSTSSRVIAGESYGALFGTRFSRSESGDVLIDDNGFPIVDPESGVIGDPIPDFLMGIRNTFSYKNFTLSALLDIRQGGDVWCGTCGITDYFGTSQRSAELRGVTDFVFDGVNANTGEVNTTEVALADPANGLGGNYFVNNGFGGVSEDYIFDSSWVRLREASLTYALPNNILDKTFLTGGSITFTGRNLFLITDYPGIDPETNLTGSSNGIGLDYFNQPNTKSYAMTVRLNF